ncbi:triphosphoribosyl-dephospho-CoA synthase [Natronocella acetinitrilica]|uniref:Probable 2-(5''-triphosphoribosyl)-3'-dephosphocoenzyme-A synthase n=1 Tax=Natronocella acetinitrilica TaxID=414046 RepID=A0AAE3K9Y7_9GAMM|nr:triphosphoribosyl-dephospho-CoA synthase MdcB [Natronocella acetinitrilica]MCP1673415.1 triphosphoribosyl-dephospho-CoA synthase [Natronocella acetinitrilica]
MNAPALVTSPATERFRVIDRCAINALLDELACYPKPGLVSFVDSGSHDDMSAATFLRSIEALRGYFAQMAAAGADDASFRELNVIGRTAEARMFDATGGRNTHRGAVFSLGLLAGAAGRRTRTQKGAGSGVCEVVGRRWGEEILAVARTAKDTSHGDLVRRRYGANGARDQAAAGFPTVREHALPAYRQVREQASNPSAAAVHALFAIMAALEDNNLLYRAGPEGLDYARTAASGFLSRGGMIQKDGHAQADAIHRRFVAYNLSPGGAADLLAATLFVVAWEQEAF